MTAFCVVSKNELCDALDRVQDQRNTVTIPVRWFPTLNIIEDEEEPPIGYELEDGEIYESNETKNRLAAIRFLRSLVDLLSI
jgi:hypothetical protein